MAVGEATFDQMHAVPGFRLGTTVANIKKPNRKDLVIMELAAGSTVAGTFTKNAFCAAPVLICQQNLAQLVQPSGQKLYFITNTGYANAGTGPQGMTNAQKVCTTVAECTGVEVGSVFPFSTGVIGEPLPVARIDARIPDCVEALSETGWEDAAFGIMTTDTRPKGASLQVNLLGKTVTITGLSKGAGMICPNMATMLAYVATDAQIDAKLLQRLAREATEQSFNAITVDSDTSTNDSCMLAATGCSGVVICDDDAETLATFKNALNQIYRQLAHAIIRDGEGATKFVEIAVTDAASVAEAKTVAFTVAHSPLVKTALFASDPNWGRILAAVGRSDLPDLDVTGVSISINGLPVAEAGAVAKDYSEAAASKAMQNDEISIGITLRRGDCGFTVWTTDFSYDYVKINADYRT